MKSIEVKENSVIVIALTGGGFWAEMIRPGGLIYMDELGIEVKNEGVITVFPPKTVDRVVIKLGKDGITEEDTEMFSILADAEKEA